MTNINSNVIPFNETAASEEVKHYQEYDAKYRAESQHIHKLEQQYNKLLNDNNAQVIAQQKKQPPKYHYVTKKTNGKGVKKTERVKVKDTITANGMTDAEKKAFFERSKYYRPLTNARRRLKKYKIKMKRYKNGKRKLTEDRRKNSITGVKQAMANNQMNNSYILCNAPDSDTAYILMQVQTESDDHSTNAATQPIEHDMNVVTTTQMSAPQISITAKIGVDTSDFADDGSDDDDAMNELKRQINQLQHWSHQGVDMFWEGPHEYQHCIITEVSSSYNWGADGTLTTVDVSMTLTVANYFDSEGKSKEGAAKHTGAKGRSRGRSSKAKNQRHFTVTKSGENLAYIANKKNVSVQDLRDKNGMFNLNTHIGDKIYY